MASFILTTSSSRIVLTLSEARSIIDSIESVIASSKATSKDSCMEIEFIQLGAPVTALLQVLFTCTMKTTRDGKVTTTGEELLF